MNDLYYKILLLLSPTGRVSRASYFTGVFVTIVLFLGSMLLLGILQGLMPEELFISLWPWLMILYLVLHALLIIRFALLSMRRLHDLGYKGAYSAILLFAPFSIILFLILLFKKGQKGENKYGGDPAFQDFYDSK